MNIYLTEDETRIVKLEAEIAEQAAHIERLRDVMIGKHHSDFLNNDARGKVMEETPKQSLAIIKSKAIMEMVKDSINGESFTVGSIRTYAEQLKGK